MAMVSFHARLQHFLKHRQPHRLARLVIAEPCVQRHHHRLVEHGAVRLDARELQRALPVEHGFWAIPFFYISTNKKQGVSQIDFKKLN